MTASAKARENTDAVGERKRKTRDVREKNKTEESEKKE